MDIFTMLCLIFLESMWHECSAT